ncbi:MAG: N-acetylglucosaminyldiphosphoundecaprenol N-acetyl-beta-D-mannosaminyltransferase [Solirubrobacteraceae bacterium]|nr:N-acetylglucosaminyldiphosphoundecaprenol N-acetyl-beta-D-mannosaminyltransferase [Solirubrobacteraceae bacterium]
MDSRRAEALDRSATLADAAGNERAPVPHLRGLPAGDGSAVGGAGTRRNGSSRIQLFGIPIALAEPAQMLRTITGWAGEGKARRVMYVNAHVVNQSQSRDLAELGPALRKADLIYCDGYGVRMAARTLDLPVPHRMTGADWVWGLAALCEVTGLSLYLLGSNPPLARTAAERLQRWYPRLKIAGCHHGYCELESPQNDRVIEDINARRPNIVLVGMGTPKQELWVDRYSDRLDVDVLWTVGALFDYLAGRVPRAPRWLADNGFEWIFRLAIEPHRMWRRYLLGNPVFVSRVLGEARRNRTAH